MSSQCARVAGSKRLKPGVAPRLSEGWLWLAGRISPLTGVAPYKARNATPRGQARVIRNSSAPAGESAVERSSAGNMRPLGPRHSILLAILALLAMPATLAFSADDRAKSSVSPVLHLTNGGYVAGDLKPSAAASRLGWQSPLFTSPFAFEVAAVNAVHFPLPAVMPKAQGDFRFELSQGDVVFGKLAGWEGDRLEIDVSRVGRLNIAKSDVLRINRWRDSTDLVY